MPPRRIRPARSGWGESASAQGGSVDPVESTGEVDNGFAEQSAKQLDLLLLPNAAGTEVLAQRLVLDVVPPDAHTEAQPAAGQEIDIGRLPRHERPSAAAAGPGFRWRMDPLRDGGQIGEQHQRVVERVALGIAAGQPRRSTGVDSAEQVVIGEKVVKAQVLDRSPDPPYRVWVPAELGLRVDDADLHDAESATHALRRLRAAPRQLR